MRWPQPPADGGCGQLSFGSTRPPQPEEKIYGASTSAATSRHKISGTLDPPYLGGTLLLDSDITPEHRLLQCVRPSLSNLEHYSGRNVGAVMFQVRQQKSKGLAQAVFRKKTSGNHLGLDQTLKDPCDTHSSREYRSWDIE